MIARALLVFWCPGIDVDVLKVDASGRDGAGDPDVVELLRVLVEGVSVAFLGWDLGDLVEGVHEVLKGLEDRTSLDVLIVVTSNDDACPGVDLQDRLDEILMEKKLNKGSESEEKDKFWLTAMT